MNGQASGDWQTLATELAACRLCPRLVAWRAEVARTKRRAYLAENYWGRPVPGFGDPAARVLAVGLAPGAHGANRTGRMFTGDSSGDFLYAALHRAGFASQATSTHRGDGLALSDLFVSAVCRCAPPNNKPTAAEIATCLPYLVQELALLERVRVIIALGRIAFDGVLRIMRDRPGFSERAGRFGFGHGVAFQLGENLPWLVASYHPSRQNTQTGRLTVEMFDAVWERVRQL